MHPAKKVVLAIAIVLIGASSSLATSITFVDVFDPADVFFSGQSGVSCTGTNDVIDTTSASTCESLTWTQSLDGYDDFTDTLSTGTLTLTAYNDSTMNGQSFNLLFDLLSVDGTVVDGSTLGSPNVFGMSVLGQLLDGVVNLTLTSHNGNHTFYFAGSQLDASGDRLALENDFVPLGDLDPPTDELTVAAVPEPGSLLLLGTGLVLAARRLRRK